MFSQMFTEIKTEAFNNKKVFKKLKNKNKKQNANRFSHNNLDKKSNHTLTIHIHVPNQEKKK